MAPTTGRSPPSCSWTMSPRVPIMAARPLFSSMPRFWSLASSLNLSHPKSMYPLRKSPTNSPVPSTSFMTESSRTAMKATIWARPAPGMASGPWTAPHPSGKEAKASPDLSMSPGRWIPLRVTICPRKASMQMRPCLISTNRRRSNCSWSPPATSPRGSKNPSGGWDPRASSKAASEVVVVAACLAGAKAAAVAIRVAKTADFMAEIGWLGVVWLWLWFGLVCGCRILQVVRTEDRTIERTKTNERTNLSSVRSTTLAVKDPNNFRDLRRNKPQQGESNDRDIDERQLDSRSSVSGISTS
mmetsp:Transcript_16306/g.37365  ORF Transcript_16306/g.37365 Transcript_16306/m.37365 type:complete len:300 (-) Transcript_16306:48-947(-)